MRRFVFDRYPIAAVIPYRGYIVVHEYQTMEGWRIDVGIPDRVVVAADEAASEARLYRLVRGPGWYYLDIEGYDVIPIDLAGLAALARLVATGDAKDLVDSYGCGIWWGRIFCAGVRIDLWYGSGSFWMGIKVDQGMPRPRLLLVPRVPLTPEGAPLFYPVGVELYAWNVDILQDVVESLAAMSRWALRLYREKTGSQPRADAVGGWRVHPAVLTVPSGAELTLVAPDGPGILAVEPGYGEDAVWYHEGRLRRVRVRTGPVLGVGDPSMGRLTLDPWIWSLLPVPGKSSYVFRIPPGAEDEVEALVEALFGEAGHGGGRRPGQRGGRYRIEGSSLVVAWEPGSASNTFHVFTSGTAPYVEVPAGRLEVRVKGGLEEARREAELLARLQRLVSELLEA